MRENSVYHPPNKKGAAIKISEFIRTLGFFYEVSKFTLSQSSLNFLTTRACPKKNENDDEREYLQEMEGEVEKIDAVHKKLGLSDSQREIFRMEKERLRKAIEELDK